MVQSKTTQPKNVLHELGYKIFLDRYAQKDMTRATLAVGDKVIVVVDSKTGQREIGTVTALDLPKVSVQLLDGEMVERDVEHVDKPLETEPGQMMDRVAAGIASVESTPELQKLWAEHFRWLLDDWKFVPAGRILAAAGTDQELTYYNCYVIPSPRDSRGGIIETLRQMTEIMSRGGGVGINVSSLRPRHAYVKGVNGRSSGAVSWGGLYSFVTGLIEQGGCFGPQERIATHLGLIPARELADRFEAGETMFAHTHRGLRRITARFRNGVKPLYELKTARGYTVRITEDHKVAVLMDGQITTMPLKYLQPGDEILLLLGEGVQADYVRLSPVQYKRSVMSTTLNENVRLPETLDEDLAYLVGYMYGDGYVHSDKKVNWHAPKAIRMATADAYPEIRRRIIETTQRVFGITPTVDDREEASANVSLYSRLVVEWLAQNDLLKAKADLIRVPEAIFRSPSPVQAAFIAGYFDADGCNRGRKGGYGIDSISRAMLEDVQQLLALNGIVSRIIATDRSAQGWRTIYRLTVTGGEFKKRFAAFVPGEKVSAENNGTREMYNTYPAGVWSALNARAKYRQRIYDGVSERISYGQMTHIRQRLEADGQAATVEQVDDLLRTLPDTIVSITPVGESDTYDFEVEDVHLLSGNGVYTSNSRRGALMLILDDWHPDVFDFINSKRKAGQITNANISVGVSDKLMEAVKADGDWTLMFPDTSEPGYDEEWDGNLEKWLAAGRKVIHYRTVKARAVWDAIIESAWASAEPGVFFRERYNKMSNSWYFAPIISTNPCVTGDTRIYTNQGLVQARELFDNEQNADVVIDGRFGHQERVSGASRVFMTGTKPVFRLQTKEGYYIRATTDHRIMTARGWRELQELSPGDKIHILNRKGGFGVKGSIEVGRVLGWLIGDGTIKSDSVQLSFFGDEKRELAPMFAEYVNELVAPLTTRNRDYTVGVTQVTGRDEARVGSTRLRLIAEEYGLTEKKHRVPEVTYQGCEDMQRGFLQGLFTADGSFQDGGEKGASVRLAANEVELLEGVQLLLLNFGIASRIYQNRRAAGYRNMPNSDRELVPYWCEAQHELVVSKHNMVVFADEIGFLMEYKQSALKDYITRGKRGPYAEHFTATVESITQVGVEDVFDLTEPLTSSFIGNGIVVHNCGEQGLPSFGVCNLGAINLARFYDEEKHDVKWDELEQTARFATRFLDNVIDNTPYFFEPNRQQQMGERRVGLNNMGLAELMIRLGIRYGSDESVQFIDKLYGFLARVVYETSTELAQEKGAFPQFDARKFLQSGFMKSMPRDIRDKVKKRGIRNVTLLTQAPTGTTGTMVNTSTGIEPFFSWVYYRKSRLGLHEEQVPLVKDWFEAHPDETDLPDYFVTAMDLTPEEHVKVQGAIQRWVDSSISKCVVGDTLVLTDEGLQPIEDLSEMREPDTFADLDIMVRTSGGHSRATAFYYNGMRPTLRLSLAYGFEIEGTHNHPVRVLDADGTSVFKPLSALRIGDIVPLYMGQRQFGRPGKPLPAYQGRWDVTNTKPIRLPGQMSEELAYLLGCITSEGTIGRNGVSFVNSDRQIVERVAGLFESLFDMKCRIERDNRRDSLYYVRANSRALRSWLVDELGMLPGAKNKTIPNCILGASAGEIGHFLRGLFLDAYMTLDGKMFGIGLASRKLLKQLQVLLLNFGIVARMHKAGANAWSVTVAGSDLGRLAAITAFDEVWKNERMARRDDGRQMKARSYSMLLPEQVSGELHQAVQENERSLRSLYPDRASDYQRVRVALMRSTKIRRQDAYEVYQAFEDTSSDYLKQFFAHDKEGCVYLEVKAIQSGFAEVFDITVPDGHEFIANGICNHNTANLPNNYTVEQTRALYEYMYELGCKGGTVYRDGSRDEQVLILKEDTPKLSEKKVEESRPVEQVATPHRVYPRPRQLAGVTVSRKTPFGTAFITMNSDEHNNPFEVFITVGKAGSDLQADAEGLGRMISLQLRTTAPQNRAEMLKLVIDQLQGIGGSRSVGMGPSRVMSLPDAVAGALLEHYFPQSPAQQLNLPLINGGAVAGEPKLEPDPHNNGIPAHGIISGADICPECGLATLVRAEGCEKCLSCGYSRC